MVVPGAALFTAGMGGHPSNLGASSPNGESSWCSQIVMASPAGLRTAAGGERYVFSADPGETVVFSANAASRRVRRALPPGVAPETGLQVQTILAARAISAVFPEITQIGGVRADALRWHPNGLAIDVMIPNYDTDAGSAIGDHVVAFALANADRFGLNHVIWRQVIWSRRRAPHVMSDAGSDDANHVTHVHIATNGGGYPTGGEIYLR